MKSSLATDIRNLIVGRVQSADASEVLAIASAISANEPRVTPLPAPARTMPPDRFTRIGADGKPTLDAQDEWVAVYDAETDLTWTAEPLKCGEVTHAEALKAAAECRLLKASDWRAPTIRELLSIVDYDRCDPAVNPEFFKGPYSWHWSSTVAKAPAGYAWFVSLDGGGSSRSVQSYPYHVRAVRCGQQFNLGI